MREDLLRKGRRGASVAAGTLLTLLMLSGACPVASFVDSERAQERLERAVRHELVMLPFHGLFDNLEFNVEGFTVTLLGQVIRPVLKEDAEAAVKGIEGVERVDNRIEVLPLSPDDDRIRFGTYRAIFRDPSLNRYLLRAVIPIHIVVKNGNVILEGAVETEMDKTLAGIRAREVRGAFSLTNNLRVVKE